MKWCNQNQLPFIVACTMLSSCVLVHFLNGMGTIYSLVKLVIQLLKNNYDFWIYLTPTGTTHSTFFP